MTIEDLRVLAASIIKQRGDTQTEISKNWGIPQNTLSRFLSGRGMLNGKYTLRLLEYVALSQKAQNEK